LSLEERGLVDVVVELLGVHLSVEGVQASGIDLLGRLAYCEASKQRAADSGALGAIATALSSHRHSKHVVQAGANALLKLTYDSALRSIMAIEAGVLEALQAVLSREVQLLEASVMSGAKGSAKGSAKKGGAKAYNIGPAADLSFPVTQLGDDAALLTSLPADVVAAFANAQRPAIIVGMGALKTPGLYAAARAAAAQLGVVKDGWNGFNLVHTAAARAGALRLGLAVDGGVNALLGDTGIKALFLLGADEVNVMAGRFTVYIGTHGDHGVRHADVILPAAAYTEMPGTYVNMEGRVQRALKATQPPGDAAQPSVKAKHLRQNQNQSPGGRRGCPPAGQNTVWARDFQPSAAGWGNRHSHGTSPYDTPAIVTWPVGHYRGAVELLSHTQRAFSHPTGERHPGVDAAVQPDLLRHRRPSLPARAPVT
jgi:hypothetical protein